MSAPQSIRETVERPTCMVSENTEEDLEITIKRRVEERETLYQELETVVLAELNDNLSELSGEVIKGKREDDEKDDDMIQSREEHEQSESYQDYLWNVSHIAEDGGLEDDNLEVGRASSESEGVLDPESERTAMFRTASGALSRAEEGSASRRSSSLPGDNDEGRGDDLEQYDTTVPIYSHGSYPFFKLTSDVSKINPDDTRYLCLRSLVRIARIVPGRNVLPAADRAFRAACNPPTKMVMAYCTDRETNCRVTIRQQDGGSGYDKHCGWGKDENYKTSNRQRMTALATTALGPHGSANPIGGHPEKRWICGVCLGITVPIRGSVAYLVPINAGINCHGCKVFSKRASPKHRSALVSVI